MYAQSCIPWNCSTMPQSTERAVAKGSTQRAFEAAIDNFASKALSTPVRSVATTEEIRSNASFQGRLPKSSTGNNSPKRGSSTLRSFAGLVARQPIDEHRGQVSSSDSNPICR